MQHSQNNSRPSLQGKGKAAAGHAGASILASVDGKAGRQRATNKQAAALGAPGQRRIWVWALPLALGAVAAGGAVLWMQRPAVLVASAPSVPSAGDRAANRSAEQAAFVEVTYAANTSLEAQSGAQINGHSIDAHQTSTQTSAPSAGQSQGAYIEDASALASGASPFAALQDKANAQAEIASPFQALNEAAPPLPGSRVASAHAGKEAGKQAAGRMPAHSSKPLGRAPALAVASASPTASVAGPAALLQGDTSRAVLARVDSSQAERGSKRAVPAVQSDAKGPRTTGASASSAMAVSTPARSAAESPEAANTVAAIKPAVAAVAASAAQAAASAAVAEAPTALGSGDPLNSLLKAAGHAAAAVTAQGVSRLTRAETPQPTAATGQPGTAASAQNAAADARNKPTALEKSAAESRAADGQTHGGQTESAPAPSKRPNNKPEKAKAPDPDVTLMRALMRHLETTSK